MKPSLLDKICCPFDRHELEIKIITKDQEYNIIEGLLSCNHCNRMYPIIHGVPVMTPDEYRVPAIEQPILERLLLTDYTSSGS
jgi:uncharacterized protein YbaR (Trm112 family)